MKNKKQKRQKKNQPPSGQSKGMTRRDILAWAKTGAIGAGVIGLGGWYFVSEVRANIREQDLSRLGNGQPTVVQIHDPGCSSCIALQRETRKAIDALPDGAVQFLVANITTGEGRQFATKHKVGHVTLILFDGQGRRKNVLVGNHDAVILQTEIGRLLPRSDQTGS